MAPTTNGSQIVATWHGASCATGEYYAKTADGSVWKVLAGPVADQTSLGRGVVEGGKIRRTS